MSPTSTPAELSLVTLTPEIQRHIVSYLIDSASKSPVHSLLYTCKRLYAISLPASVHTFRDLGVDPTAEPEGQVLHSRPRIWQFLRYVTVTKPELAPFVATIVVSDLSAKHRSSQRRGKRRQYALPLVNRMFPDQKDLARGWFVAIQNGTRLAALALLFVACPRLSKLQHGPIPRARYFRALLAVSEKRQILTNLEHLSSGFTHIPRGYTKTYCPEHDAFFLLPSLRTLEYKSWSNTDSYHQQFQDIAPQSCGVESLILTRMEYLNITFHSMLRMFRGLRIFHCHFIDSGLYCWPLCEALSEVLCALLPHAETLQDLRLDFEEDMLNPDMDDRTSRRRFNEHGLRGFVVLKTLVVDAQSLNHLIHGTLRQECVDGALPSLAECLPQHLEHLEVLRCRVSVMRKLTDFLAFLGQAPGEFPFLKLIRLIFCRDHHSVCEGDLEKLVCGRKGLRLEIMAGRSRRQREE
ncbi:hypothetical protein ANO11243_036450 [Dothideomycetidae sp. 11243]|nr:hypothetical protein ANO11243_036450 [fungal sp. No.11243]